jgi:thiamine-phosphate pyrophosphorylase
MKALCKDFGVPLIINDNVEVAMRCAADGIHVGQQDMEAKNVRALVGNNMMLGVSAQTVEQAMYAENCGADYLGVGAVFATKTKLDADIVGHETLKEICAVVSIPVVAIGGIDKHNVLGLSESGVDGIALVSAIFGSHDIESECRALRTLSEEMVKR